MKAFVLCYVATCLLTVDDGPKSKADLKDLQGTWRVVSMQIGDDDVNQLTKKELAAWDFRWTFSGNQLSQVGNTQGVGTCPGYSIEVSDGHEANFIDLQFNGNTSKYAGIYKFEDKKLVICSGLQPGAKNRPKKFAAEAGSGNGLIVLERVK